MFTDRAAATSLASEQQSQSQICECCRKQAGLESADQGSSAGQSTGNPPECLLKYSPPPPGDHEKPKGPRICTFVAF